MVLASEASPKVHVRQEKRHVRVVKPGEVTAAARHTAPWMASSVPRTIRNRSLRKVRPGKSSPVSPGSPHQQEVVNAVTGRRALGPWSGPFKGHPDSSLTEVLLPDTIFMDSVGAAHLGLDVEEHHKLLRALQEAQESNGVIENAAPVDVMASNTAGQVMDLRRAQLERTRALDFGAHASRQPFPSMRQQRALLKRDSQVNQPRRLNYSNLILKNAKMEHGMQPANKSHKAKTKAAAKANNNANRNGRLESMFEAA